LTRFCRRHGRALIGAGCGDTLSDSRRLFARAVPDRRRRDFDSDGSRGVV